ncbi:GRAS family transcription factor [Striga asiatica]|uniref:GRAS family transcription factor n=1 Tax=Striga asiatica TaxID=4170 RepID=A0A5A7RC74_STRAF|nr:GRAS family transcription factor [Striga asiatica]
MVPPPRAVPALNDLSTFDRLISESRTLVSVHEDPLQRLGGYMLEALIARLDLSGSSIYKSLKCKEPQTSDLLSYMHLLYKACPYFKFGHLSANGAITEAMRDEPRIHIIDFQIAQGSQWAPLIQAVAGRPGGPPRVPITGIDDPVLSRTRGGGLEIVGRRLSGLAQLCGFPLEFCRLLVSGCEIEMGRIEVRAEESVAVNFALVLHHMADENVGPGLGLARNDRDRVLRMVRGLSPNNKVKVMTLVEQEMGTSGGPFVARFVETLDYYLAVFELMDVVLSRER